MSASEYLRPHILDRIPLNQHALIEASAGTGKTFTLEHLVVEILLKASVSIDKILVVTFTEKATDELRARIRATLDSAVSTATLKSGPDQRALDGAAIQTLRDALFAFDRASIQTIHGFCHRMLTELAFQSGMRFRVEITDKQSSFHEAFRAELREHIEANASASELLSQWLNVHNVEALEKLLLDAHRQRYLDTGDPARHGSATSKQRAALPLEVRVADEFLPRIAARLDRVKRERGVLDYDDMLAWLARALDGPHGGALCAALRERYRYALIDEFQDTDDLQWSIFRRIFIDGSTDNFIYLIGDPKQAIYSFRGADVATYLRARRELRDRGVNPVPLVENFRSTKQMIGALNTILKQDVTAPLFDGDIRYDFPVTCGREDLRALDADSNDLKAVTLLKLTTPHVLPAGRARVALGRHIARTIKQMLTAGPHQLRISDSRETRTVSARDIFILTRTNVDSATIGKLLREVSVPFAFYKQDGLFLTREAADIVDALRGVDEPGIRSRRLKAWTTPFFAVVYAELPKFADLPPSHPLLERLYEWKALAEEQRFAEMFDAMLHQSGLVDRELFFSESGRELTNYLHIFEILLEKAVAMKLALAELIELLEGYITQRALPGGDDSDVQRLESERDAVQIMTIHKSKGLEAGVVFLFGGLFGFAQSENAAVYHERDARRVALGLDARHLVKPQIDREKIAEDQRLTYVAITRARAKLYLPLFPAGSTTKPTGYYKHLNSRLETLAGSLARDRSVSNLFAIEQVREAAPGQSDNRDVVSAVAAWKPPPMLLDDSHDGDAQQSFFGLRERHAPLRVMSYSSMQSERQAARERESLIRSDPDPEDFKITFDAAEPRPDSTDLAGGRNVGVFLHEVIEKLDLDSFNRSPDFKSWSTRDDIRDLFETAMRRRGVANRKWFDRGREIVFNTLTSRIALGASSIEGGLHRLPAVREMEFAYPIPESTHPLLGTASDGAWTAERGYIKGFIDFVFQHDALTYFADWKGDLLPSYAPIEVERHVKLHYELQAQIYTVGIVRMLGIRSPREYNSQFGGLLYLFLRGIAPAGDGTSGVYFIRPSWPEIVTFESALTGNILNSESLQ